MKYVFVILMSAAVAAPAFSGDRDHACKQLHDVIRQTIDQIVPGTSTNRLLTALSAAERLDCDVNGLLVALRLTPITPADGQSNKPAAKRDSDK